MAAPWFKVSQGASFSQVGSPSNPSATAYRLSPDGKWVVYTQDAETDTAMELWSVPSFGGTPRRLSPPLPIAKTTITDFQITPDSSRVVYNLSSGDPVDQGFRIYGVPIAGGPSIELSGDLGASGKTGRFEVVPGGQRVVYTAIQSKIELYSVPVMGGGSVKLNGELAPAKFVPENWVISPNGQRVVYAAEQVEGYGVYSVPVAGGAPQKLTGAFASGGRVEFSAGELKISPDSQWVVYRADRQTLHTPEIYSVPLAGGSETRLNGSLASGGYVMKFSVGPTAQRVFYLADQATVGVFELFSAPIGGGAAVKLNGTLTSGGDVDAWAVTPDGQHVIYRADQVTDDRPELFEAPASGGTATKITNTVNNNGRAGTVTTTSNSQTVVYDVDSEGTNSWVGWRVPISGPASANQAVWLGVRSASTGQFVVDEARDRVVVRGYDFLSGNTFHRLWRYPLTPDPDTFGPDGPVYGGVELVPSAAFRTGGQVQSFKVYSDGTVLYVADQETAGKTDLYSVPAMIFWDGFESGNTSAW